ncbi:MAG: hypothetical protein AMS23_07370 [Bacteroides sp. SM1_62]|nr:MAG: hypothetical protein AMS26_01595 [Bacteroides sp. SM23_62]KPL22842.1 MAG: hypothetical protein AMS23_07370 [Bacteroides sp. SM1_62]
MKTTKSRSIDAFPSPLRLVIYLVLIAAICALNCLTEHTGKTAALSTGNVDCEILAETLQGIQYSQPAQE